jgi:hypothetical protein
LVITNHDLVPVNGKINVEKPQKKVYYESLISRVAKKAQASKPDQQVNNTQDYYNYTPVDMTM